MTDDLWSRIPADAVNPWDAGAMRSLIGTQFGYDAVRSDGPYSARVPMPAVRDAFSRSIPVAGLLRAGRSRGFTPVPLDGFEEWGRHFSRGRRAS